MITLFDLVSERCSYTVTTSYSTSFSLASRLLSPNYRKGIYAIYGFVRVADEIVDSFFGYPQRELLSEFRRETNEAISRGISTNPILHNFARAVSEFKIQPELIDSFLQSMEWDLDRKTHDEGSYKRYIFGSAEAVGLMCLRVFSGGDDKFYQSNVESAKALGAAFQKVNFLRDLKHDYEILGRTYFPKLAVEKFGLEEKRIIERDIEEDLEKAIAGIRGLPRGAKLGVYVAYVYYSALFSKLKEVPPEKLRARRIRVSDSHKILLLVRSWIRCYSGAI